MFSSQKPGLLSKVGNSYLLSSSYLLCFICKHCHHSSIKRDMSNELISPIMTGPHFPASWKEYVADWSSVSLPFLGFFNYLFPCIFILWTLWAMCLNLLSDSLTVGYFLYFKMLQPHSKVLCTHFFLSYYFLLTNSQEFWGQRFIVFWHILHTGFQKNCVSLQSHNVYVIGPHSNSLTKWISKPLPHPNPPVA